MRGAWDWAEEVQDQAFPGIAMNKIEGHDYVICIRAEADADLEGH